MPKVSVIIPVYNVEKYLRQCLDSVINQTLTDIEIICVDDCSTDSSLQILKEYANKDSRIKIIEQSENQGQGVARNIAIKQSKGEYIGFVDPDDWIEPNMYEDMYTKAKELDTEIVFCDMEKNYEKDNKQVRYNLLEQIQREDINIRPNKIFNFQNTEKYFLPMVRDYAWARIYKRNFILKNNLYFLPFFRGEDTLFCGMANYLANKVTYIDKVFYHYRHYRAVQFPKNVNIVQICLIYLMEFNKLNISNELKEGVSSKLAQFNLFEYKILNKTDRLAFIQNCKNYLPFNTYQKFKKKLFKYKLHKKYLTIKKIIKNIFSIRNDKDKKHKVITILGIKVKIRKKMKTMQNERILYCKIGWAERYDGTDKNPPVRGGKYNEDSIGFEYYNFRDYNGTYYGFVEEPGYVPENNDDTQDKRKPRITHIDITRLGAKKGDAFVDNVLVVFVATRENGGQVIVGWYNNAKVYWERQEVPEEIMRMRDKNIHQFNLETNDVFLLAPHARTQPILYRGRSNIYYGKDVDSEEVLRYINEVQNR